MYIQINLLHCELIFTDDAGNLKRTSEILAIIAMK
jgi:hypothetical protein